LLHFPLKAIFSKKTQVTGKHKLKGVFISKKVGFHSLIEIAEADFGNFRTKYLGENEAIFEMALANGSGDYQGIF
jgi:hypothetical protein